MKKSLQFVVVVAMAICLFGSSLAVFGQSLVPPIWSQDALREANLANVVRGARGIYAPSINWDYLGSVTWTNAVGSGAEEVLDKLFQSELVYQLANGTDTIEGHVYLYDKHDRLLFYGSTRYTLAELKKAKPTYSIWMQNAPILENVQSAEVLALDADGKTAKRIPLEVDAYGQVLFQPWLAGSPNGILSVKLKDSTLLTYSLVSPIANVPGAYKDSAEAYQIDGHHIFSDPTTVKIIETWNRPTVYLRISADAEFKPITFDVLGLVQEAGVTSFERPTALRVVRDVPGFVPQIIDLDPKGPTTFKWPIGNYRIYFIWDKFGRPGLIYTGPSDGGKG